MKYTTNDPATARENAVARLESAALRVSQRGGIENLRRAVRMIEGADFLRRTDR